MSSGHTVNDAGHTIQFATGNQWNGESTVYWCLDCESEECKAQKQLECEDEESNKAYS